MQMDQEKREIGILKKFVETEGKKILEIGCGDGRLTSVLAEGADELVAIDPDELSIAQARRNIRGVNFRVGSGEALDFDDESFDLILFTMSLHHHADCVRALREAHRTLKKDGTLVILEPAADGELQRVYHLLTDETPGIKRALDAINGSDFTLERQATFYKNWAFEDKEELYDYHFKNYSSTDYDAGIVDSMNRLLAKKIHDRPVILQDKLTIFSMRRKP